MNFTTQRLKAVKLSQALATADPLVAALDEIENKLSDISLDDDYTQLSNICIVLNQIIQRFGGNIYPDKNVVIKVTITQDDIDNGRNIVYFSQDPIRLDGSQGQLINWGD